MSLHTFIKVWYSEFEVIKLKILKRTLVGVVLLILILMSGLIVNNILQTNSELDNVEETGERIRTEYGDYHVHTQGEGTPIIFLSGLGTTSPYYDFNPLIDNLDDDYKIIVIEKPGYGYNDSTTKDKSLDTVVNGLQAVTNAINIAEPYTIMAHSMGALEAMHWAQKSPSSIDQIVALDPAIAPMILKKHTATPNVVERNLQYLIGRLGVSRFMDETALKEVLPVLNYDGFSAHEEETIQAHFHANMFNRNIIREMKQLYNNAKIIDNSAVPSDTPILVLLSQENLDSNDHAEDIFNEYFADFAIVETRTLPTNHYIYHEYHDEIIEYFNDFTAE